MEQEVDWLVAGSGAGGMTGAVAAHQLGGTVLLAEKDSVYGGTTSMSGGVIWIPGNHRQAEAGISDSVEEGYSYLKGLIGDTVDEARLKAYAERAPEMLAFMMEHSHVHYTPLPIYMDYYEKIPGYKPGGRSMDSAPINMRKLGREGTSMRRGHYKGLMLPFNVTVVEGVRLQSMDFGAYLLGLKLLLRFMLDIPARLQRKEDNRVTLGPALIARLRRSMMDRDIPLWLDSPMKELIVEDGRVCGAVINRQGQDVRVMARRGVLLATGGFSHNVELRRQYQQAPTGSDWTAASPGATGDGIIMGQKIGAELGFMGSAWWSPTFTMPDGRSIALISGKSYPGSIMVNKLGRRFANEAQPYEDLIKQQYASEARGEGAIPCYLIFDARFRSKYSAGHLKPGKIEDDSKIPQDTIDSGLITIAPTLKALAQKLDINTPGLLDTVARFNEHARQGIDPDFGRGSSEHDRYYADKTVGPNPSLGPLEQSPFYALRCDPGDLDTKGGLLCDEYGRVTNTSGEVIPGLYAAGNTSAAVMGDTYPGAGSTIGSAMTFAYIAARHAFG